MLALRQHLREFTLTPTNSAPSPPPLRILKSVHLGEREFHTDGDQHRAHGPVEPVAHAEKPARTRCWLNSIATRQNQTAVAAAR